MSEHFIKNIEIKNFKCFKDFKAEGFGRVNLIGGKNNVGKTAFMEACYLSTSYDYYSARAIDFYKKIIEFNTYRDGVNLQYYAPNRENDIYELIKTFDYLIIVRTNFKGQEYYTDVHISKNKYKFSIEDKYTDKYVENYTYRELLDLLDINIKNTKKNYTKNFIVASNSYPNIMFDYLVSEVKAEFKEEKLNNLLYSLFKFDKIDILNGVPTIFENRTHFPLKELGQGIKSFIYNIASILISKNEVIFIDEIENGLHYSLFDEMWKIILKISSDQNVQVFATTHSKECIESYARVAKRLENKEIAFIELCKREEEIKAFVYPSDWFIDEIEQEHEVRGCL